MFDPPAFAARATRCSLLCGLGLALASADAATAQMIQMPSFSLPTATNAPRLVVRPADLPALRTRKTDSAYSGYFNAFRGVVDGALGTMNFATLGDDRLASVAKGAGLLEQLGETPPGTRFTRYRDVAVLALKSLSDREGAGLFGGGNLNALQDAGRLQSMAEGYDMLRGTGVATVDDDAVRAKLADWANAYMEDAQLGFRVNNWQIKSGAALVTTALAMSDHPDARGWFTRGLGWINASLEQMGTASGWYREGVHYLNYSLNNLVSTAYHARNAAGADWFTALKPFVRFSLDTRLPDGTSAPFEEGVSNVLPHHVMWGAYGQDPIAGEMVWAWQNSTKDLGNYDNQQLHSATAFVFFDATVAPRAPTTSPTRFYDGDSAFAALRSTHGADGRVGLLYGALDYANTELIDSRHNTRSPLDFVMSGAGANILPTSGGGPQVTTSANRGYYLLASSKNLPLVAGTAPFLMMPSDVSVGDRLDAHDSNNAPGFVDAVSMTVPVYAGARSVTRTALLVGGEYFVVADAMAANAAIDFAIPWRGRGTRTLGSVMSSPLTASWVYRNTTLDLFAAAAPAGARLASTSGFYAERFGTEEAISGARVELRGADVRVLSVLEPRASMGTMARVAVDLSSGLVAALRIEGGAHRDTLAASTPSGGGGLNAGDVVGRGKVVVARERMGTLAAFAGVGVELLRFGGREVMRVEGSALTFSAELGTNALRVVLSGDTLRSNTTVVFADLPGVDLGQRYGATLDGRALDSRELEQTAQGFRVTLVRGGVLRIAADLPPPADGGVRDAGLPMDAGAPVMDAGTAPDAGLVPDAGTAADAGTPVDGGTSTDGGTVIDGGARDGGLTNDGGLTIDAGLSADAGMPPRDAGMNVDAGVAPTPPSSGCAVAQDGTGAGSLAWAALFALAFASIRRRKAGRAR